MEVHSRYAGTCWVAISPIFYTSLFISSLRVHVSIHRSTPTTTYNVVGGSLLLRLWEEWTGLGYEVAFRAPASKSEYLLEVVDAQAAFPASGLERERVMLLVQNS